MAAREKLAVVISNHNKSQQTLSCVNSVLNSNGFDKDTLKIFVIDNASDSPPKIPPNSMIKFVRSDIDLGSAGGLNLGMTLAASEGFKYICCLGEMITLDLNALRIMLDYMIENPDTGLVGAKVYHRHMPTYIQQFGISVDFKNYRAATLYADVCDSPDIPNVVYCDAVGACAMLVNSRVLNGAGLMPEENFLYWDDMEWGYRIKNSGFNVVALGDAKAYHGASPLHRHDNTKVNYYMTRGCISFFMKYTPTDKCAKMSLELLKSVFESFYLHRMGHAHNMAQSDLSALSDALYGLEGKAPQSRILSNDETGLLFVNFFEEHDRIYIEEDDPFLEQVIRQINPDIVFLPQPERDAVTIVRCPSILGIQDFKYPLEFGDNVAYIDDSYRMLATAEDVNFVRAYEAGLGLFLYSMQPMMLRRISEMRGVEF